MSRKLNTHPESVHERDLMLAARRQRQRERTSLMASPIYARSRAELLALKVQGVGVYVPHQGPREKGRRAVRL